MERMLDACSARWNGRKARGAGASVECVSLERLRAPFSHRFEALGVQRHRRAAPRAGDLALCLQLAKPLAERCIATRAGHRDLRVTQEIDHRNLSIKLLACMARLRFITDGSMEPVVAQVATSRARVFRPAHRPRFTSYAARSSRSTRRSVASSSCFTTCLVRSTTDSCRMNVRRASLIND